MKRKMSNESVNSIDKRLLNNEELKVYLGLGRRASRTFAENANAVVRVGSRVVYDKVKLDEALDKNGGN